MTWPPRTPRLWRQRLDARPAVSGDRGDEAEIKLQAVSRAERGGDPARAAALYGAPGFRRCGACDVTWHGDERCWCGPGCGHGCSGIADS